MSRTDSRDDELDGEAGHVVADERALGDPLPGRLQPDEAAFERGDPDRAAAVVGVGDRDHPRGDRGARSRRSSPPVERPCPRGCGRARRRRARWSGRIPSSGVFVLPIVTKPAARKRSAR